MNKNSENIDFSIIWKKIHAALTEEEEEQLKSWLAESEEHQKYFDHIIAFYQNGSQFENTSEFTKEAWSSLSSKIDFSRNREKKSFMAYVASLAAALIFLLVAWFIFESALFKEQAPLQANSSIVPGAEKAILLMDDGTSYDLSSGNSLSLEEGGTEISSKGTSLTYKSDQKEIRQLRYNTLVVPRGGQFNLTLADGTEVWLNAGSTLKYPIAFIEDDRKVELIGEAYFKVKRDEKKPFKVISGEQVVEVLGTSFNISSYNEEPSVYTTLVEGKVNVYLEDEPHKQQTLLPNQQSVIVKGKHSITQREVDVMEYISWKEGWFYFKDKPLEAIMQDMARWYDVSIQFENQSATKLPFTGKIRRYENLEDVLKLLEKTKDVKFKIERRTVTIN